ncbi:energy transducer TonB [Persicitalea sp.]|uniref:energy transducer TonB n=1 Tax=Persicitalea sp. TaxID=3100273 RepID=UPI0035939873
MKNDRFSCKLIAAWGLFLLSTAVGCKTAAPDSATVNPKQDVILACVLVENLEFPGGTKALAKYIADNLKYPKTASEAKAQGKVFVTFVVTATGKLEDIRVLKGLGYGTEAEALRLVRAMPPWNPGQLDGKAISVKYNLPITFELDAQTATHRP